MPVSDNLIYALRDPRTDDVCYVGKSTSGIARAKSHFTHSHNLRVQDWVRELRSENLEPEIDILEECDSWHLLLAKEKFWIEHFLNVGTKLLNDIHAGRIQEKQIALNNIEAALEKKIEEFNKKVIYATEKIISLEDIGRFMAMNRKEKKITQKDIQELTGISERALRMMEADAGSSSLKNILKYLDVLGYTLQPVIKKTT